MPPFDPQELGRAVSAAPGYPRDLGTAPPSWIDRVYNDPRLQRAADQEGRNFAAYSSADTPHDYEGAAMNRGYSLGNKNALQEYHDTMAMRETGAPWGITPDYFAPPTSSPDEIAAKRMAIAKTILSAEPGPIGAGMAVGDAYSHAKDAYGEAKNGETREALISGAKALGLLVAGGLGFRAFAPAAREAAAASHGVELPVLNAAGERVYRPAMPWEPREAIEALGGRVRLTADGAPMTREIPYGFNPVQEQRLKDAGAGIGMHAAQEGRRPVWQLETPNAQPVPRLTEPSAYPREAPLFEVPASYTPGSEVNSIIGSKPPERSKMIQAVDRRNRAAQSAQKEWAASEHPDRDFFLNRQLRKIDADYENAYAAYTFPQHKASDLGGGE